MLDHINPYNLIFIDIETVPAYPSFSQLSPGMQALWAIKHATLKTENESAEDGYLKRAGVYAEFAKIVCFSIGYFYFDRDKKQRIFRLKSLANDDEKRLLGDLVELFQKSFKDTERYHFSGHNIREFDIPFICRRLLINHLDLPPIFDLSGKRPWEMQDADTMQLWKFGDYKSFTSLKLLAEVLDVPSPKEEIEGKDVCRVYWQEHGLDKIREYCQRDVVTVARLILRFKGDKEPLKEEDIAIL